MLHGWDQIKDNSELIYNIQRELTPRGDFSHSNWASETAVPLAELEAESATITMQYETPK